ncbi:hypothetical protein [Novosphingobium sp. 28-62-57]|uniref:hypothetical protein n=1 Tax=Novosphingobium sp. 28-62-57 TaxID=1970409 RepID=UPI0025FC58EE|nr:hypothetical protein [Novosphingobium sp. 28-62-57]HQS96680.1 hypothetical protein [Novosphingobium sp.]
MGRTLGAIVKGIAGAALVLTGNPLGVALLSSAAQDFAGAIFGRGLPKPDTTEAPIKTPRPPRVSAYGTMRLFGAQLVYDTASNGTAVDIFAVHDGEMDTLLQRYLNDDPVTLSGEFVVGGADGRYGSSKVSFYHTDGIVPGTGGTEFSVATTLLGSTIWSSSHRGDGVVMLALFSASVKAEDFQDIYPQATPPEPSLVAKWQKCPDPDAVDPLDEGAWTWTENPVRILLHYMLVREGPRPALPRSDPDYDTELAALRLAWWNRNIAPTLDYWIDAAVVCDEARTLKAGGTEAKYRAAIAHKHTDEPEKVKAGILATFDGWMAPRADGAYVIYAGKSYTPTVTIGPDQIVDYTWDGGQVDDDEAVNELVCSYISALHDYKVVQCDPWRDEDDISARGRVLPSELDPGVPSHAQVRYLAKRSMAKKNARNRGSVTTNLAGRAARGERYVNLRIEEAGTVFFDGIAEITNLSRTLSGGVTFQWVEFDPNVDAWTPATEEGEPATVGTRIAPAPLETPEITSIAFEFDGAGYLLLGVDAPDRADLTWYAHWRIDGATVWGADLIYSDTDAGSPVALRVGPVPVDAVVEVEVAYQVGDGRISAWSPAESLSTSTTSSPPSDVADFAAADGTGSSVITWRNPVSTNFGYVRLYRGTSAVFGSASQIGGDITGALGEAKSYTDTVAAGTYFYWVRPYSTGGIAGTLEGPDSAVVS